MRYNHTTAMIDPANNHPQLVCLVHTRRCCRRDLQPGSVAFPMGSKRAPVESKEVSYPDAGADPSLIGVGLLRLSGCRAAPPDALTPLKRC